MKCCYCGELAQFKCDCDLSYMCALDLGKHLIGKKGHAYQELCIELGQNELEQLKLSVQKKIIEVKVMKKEMIHKTKHLVDHIGKLHEHSLKLLDTLMKKYLDILHHCKFCESEMKIIEEIKTVEINMQIIGIDELESNIDDFYPKELKFYDQSILIMSEKAFEQDKNRREPKISTKDQDTEREQTEKELETKRSDYNEEIKRMEQKSMIYLGKLNPLSLKSKIEYFYNMLKAGRVYWTISNCFSWIKALFISNDMKYLFVCNCNVDWLYGDSNLQIWNLESKKWVEGWPNKHFKSREWKNKYPECFFETWGY